MTEREHCRNYIAPTDGSKICMRCRLPHDKFYGDGTLKKVTPVFIEFTPYPGDTSLSHRTREMEVGAGESQFPAWPGSWPAEAVDRVRSVPLDVFNQEYQGTWDSIGEVLEYHCKDCGRCRHGRHCGQYLRLREKAGLDLEEEKM